MIISVTAWAEPPLRVATWNIAFLALPEQAHAKHPRSWADIDRLSRYAQELDADIVALQEIRSKAAAEQVFGPDYTIHLSSRRHNQRVGFAVRNAVKLAGPVQDVTDLTAGQRVRHGLDLSVDLGRDGILRLLVVHLKSFCFDKPLDSGNRHCNTLRKQVPPLEHWIEARVREGTSFVVLGDFNRRFDKERASQDGTTLWRAIDDRSPPQQALSRVTQFRKSYCWDSEYPDFIDHIVLGPQATHWVVPDSFRQVVYSEAYDKRPLLSDHCPISVDLKPQ